MWPTESWVWICIHNSFLEIQILVWLVKNLSLLAWEAVRTRFLAHLFGMFILWHHGTILITQSLWLICNYKSNQPTHSSTYCSCRFAYCCPVQCYYSTIAVRFDRLYLSGIMVLMQSFIFRAPNSLGRAAIIRLNSFCWSTFTFWAFGHSQLLMPSLHALCRSKLSFSQVLESVLLRSFAKLPKSIQVIHHLDLSYGEKTNPRFGGIRMCFLSFCTIFCYL